jgi:transcriptional regulator with XRE-family HTH domain
MTRTKSLRDRLNWSQQKLADYLGVAQSAVARLEGGQKESGPVHKLLDILEAQLAANDRLATDDLPKEGAQPDDGLKMAEMSLDPLAVIETQAGHDFKPFNLITVSPAEADPVLPVGPGSSLESLSKSPAPSVPPHRMEE